MFFPNCGRCRLGFMGVSRDRSDTIFGKLGNTEEVDPLCSAKVSFSSSWLVR